MKNLIYTLTIALVTAQFAQAQRPRRIVWTARPQQTWQQPTYQQQFAPPLAQQPVQQPIQQSGQQQSQLASTADALHEVNNARRMRGLRPFIWDHGLTQAALNCAQYRAQYRIEGHTRNDFAFVPAGSFATSAGCAAWPQGMGWGSCCTYEGYTYAGAAYSFGADGQRYMHIFVR